MFDFPPCPGEHNEWIFAGQGGWRGRGLRHLRSYILHDPANPATDPAAANTFQPTC